MYRILIMAIGAAIFYTKTAVLMLIYLVRKEARCATACILGCPLAEPLGGSLGRELFLPVGANKNPSGQSAPSHYSCLLFFNFRHFFQYSCCSFFCFVLPCALHRVP